MERASSAWHLDGSLRKRLPCDLVVDGRDCKALASELSPDGLFIQLSGSALPARGAELELELRGEIGAQPISLRGVVVRRRRGESLAESGERGVEVRLVEAPLEYHEIFVEERTASGEPEPEAIEVVIEIDEGSSGPEAAAQSVGAAPDPLGSSKAGGASSEARPGNAAGQAVEQTDSASRHTPECRPDTVTDCPGPALASASPCPTHACPNAIVVYEGSELQDVYDILEKMGTHPQRARLHGPTRFEGWADPPMLFVIAAHDALSLELPPGARHDGVVRIAVTSSRSEVLGAMLRQRGYQYLVRRPYHRRALEILLRSALHAGGEHRDNDRAPLGIEAWLSPGHWHWPRPCMLLDLSPGGGLLATRESVPLLSEIRLAIRHSVWGGGFISLRGRVMRRRHDEATGEDVLALRWRAVSLRQHERIEKLLARSALGPTSPSPITGRLERFYRRYVLGAARGEAPLPAVSLHDKDNSALAAAASAEQTPQPERRRLARVTLDREVLALDESCARVLDVLAGRDLSARGLRVDPHPSLAPGQRALVSLYDSATRGTLEIEAEATRDDGPRGLALLFREMDSRTAAALQQLIASLPSVESLDSPNPARVLGQIVPARLPAALPRRATRCTRRERRRRRLKVRR